MSELSSYDLKYLSAEAENAARKAGKLIREYANKNIEVLEKSGGSSKAAQVLTEVDLRCQSLILEHLKSTIAQYDLAVLSEEQEDDKLRLLKQAFWCIDPLDGTLAFTLSQPGYSVSIALVSKYGKPLIGVVYDPLHDTTYSAIYNQGALKDGQPWHPLAKPKTDYLTLPCDRSLLERPDYPLIKQALDRWAVENNFQGVKETYNAGAVINACTALENAPSVYFKPTKQQEGGGSLWDFAATACIYHEVGALVSDFKGKPLNLNNPDTTFMNTFGVIYSTDERLHRFTQSLPFSITT